MVRDISKWLADNWPELNRDALKEERILAVRVHRAFFVGRPEKYYFINLTNLSPQRVLEVTHVWYEDENNYIPVFQKECSLPTRLDLDQSWETLNRSQLYS